MKKIYSITDRVFIYLLKSKLEEKGINCIIKNEQPPLAGEIPPVIAPPELWVMDDEQFLYAKKIIQDELTEISTVKECWKCPTCQELIEGQFNVCWRCGCSKN